MKREVLPIVSREQWLANRLVDCTSTDAAALCGVSAWKSRYQLWNIKHRGAPDDIEETEAMRLGKTLEPAIAQHLAREHGFEIEPLKEYRRIPEVRLGSSFDYVFRDRSALLEIKLVGPFQFQRGWKQTDFGLEAPVEIEAQVQQEMLCAEIPLAFIGVLCGTETYLLRREFDQPVADRLVGEARAFWASPEPEPDFAVDAAFIARLYAQATHGKVLQAGDELSAMLEDYDALGAQVRALEDQREQLRARAFMAAGDAERIELLDGRYALARTGKDVTVKEHVRKGSRSLRIYGSTQ